MHALCAQQVGLTILGVCVCVSSTESCNKKTLFDFIVIYIYVH